MRSRSKTGEDIALKHARELRSSETNSEQLLWSMLRGSQLCGLNRVTSMQVEENPYGVGMMIAEHLGLEFKFRKRNGTGSGAFYKRKTND